MTTHISDNLFKVKSNINSLTKKHQINHQISLLAVSKRKPSSAIQSAYDYGQIDFGENYLNEALEKQQQLLNLEIIWHFIGHIQSNKTKKIAENFSWAHAVDSFKIAERLSKQRPETLAPINICLQININNEESKSGISSNIGSLNKLCESIYNLPNLKLRGLMCIPSVKHSQQETLNSFQKMKAMKLAVNQHFDSLSITKEHHLDTLSMGMSNDLNEAIACGSTIVRVGTAIFGKRD